MAQLRTNKDIGAHVQEWLSDSRVCMTELGFVSGKDGAVDGRS